MSFKKRTIKDSKGKLVTFTVSIEKCYLSAESLSHIWIPAMLTLMSCELDAVVTHLSEK